MSGPRSPDELRGYGRGYEAGRRRNILDVAAEARRTKAATFLFECLVDGLTMQGVSLDAILDAQIAGAKARLSG